MPRRRVPVAVLGATGYAGVELLRLLVRHPDVEIVSLSSEQYRERRASEVYPFLAGIVDLPLAAPEAWRRVDRGDRLQRAAARRVGAARARRRGRRSPRRSTCRRTSACAIPPSTRAGTARTPRPSSSPRRSTAFPSCTATRCAARGSSRFPDAIPPAHSSASCRSRVRGLVREPVVIDAKSGTTGAGRSAEGRAALRRGERELPSRTRSAGTAIGPRSTRSCARAGAGASCIFVPHLLPVSRGILSTMYVPMDGSAGRLEQLFVGAYADEPFIVLRGASPARAARGTRHQSLRHRLALGRDARAARSW